MVLSRRLPVGPTVTSRALHPSCAGGQQVLATWNPCRPSDLEPLQQAVRPCIRCTWSVAHRKRLRLEFGIEEQVVRLIGDAITSEVRKSHDRPGAHPSRPPRPPAALKKLRTPAGCLVLQDGTYFGVVETHVERRCGDDRAFALWIHASVLACCAIDGWHRRPLEAKADVSSLCSPNLSCSVAGFVVPVLARELRRTKIRERDRAVAMAPGAHDRPALLRL